MAATMPSLPSPPSPLPAFLRPLLIVLGLAAGVGTTFRQFAATDFPVDMVIYREGVWAFLQGREVYSVPMMAGDTALPFIYPPFGALALSPFSLPVLSHNLAGDIMMALSNGLLLLCLYLVLRAILPTTLASWVFPLSAVAWGAVLGFEPVELNNGFAQINIIVMALVVLDLVPRRRRLPQGWLIGLAIAIKITPAAMLLYFLLRKKIRPIITAALSAVAATGLGALVRWDSTTEYFGSVLLGMGSGEDFGVDPTYTSNSSIQAMLTRWSPTEAWAQEHHGLLTALWAGGSLLVILAGSRIMLRLIKAQHPTEAWLIGSLIMLLISPVSWSHHWVWLAMILPVATWHLCATPLRHR
ncbi:glycosyltransferase family 87 protein [Corynebacterium sp. 22KM0430]|uniref:glycosyltransferase family 87 protein n=1 Tax=Corynebacterium sp. 22KM0430 TaxID=2989735 RepID=UPI0029C9DBD0|nr:glycosyltransferase family 87 protein [Corynebacterium sp. 22KM0430]WPF67055.1 glycosyltransferase family 87 protein [Corynebacterium sp. 22KM0430]